MRFSAFAAIPKLQIPDAFTDFPRFEIAFVFEDKSHDEIDDDRRTDGEEREVNKIHTDTCGTNAEFAAPPVADTKCLLFEPA